MNCGIKCAIEFLSMRERIQGRFSVSLPCLYRSSVRFYQNFYQSSRDLQLKVGRFRATGKAYVTAQAGVTNFRLTSAKFPTKVSGNAKLAVFVSGGGSNFRALQQAITEGRLRANIVVAVTDKLTCGACQFARKEGIRIARYPDHEQSETPESIKALLLGAEIDFIVLAGYVKLVPAEVVAAYPRAILNIHPSLLPAFGGKGFYGSTVHKAVIKSGARFTGPTVHFVDNEYDTGPILAQRVIPVNPLEDYKQLAARVLKEEHVLYPEAVAALIERRISWREDGVPVLWKAI